MKKFLKENYKLIIFTILMVLVITVEFPYYIEAPGGTINLTERIDKDYNKKDGSLNMLYVTEYKGNAVTILLSKIFKTWDLKKISNQQIADEDAHEIYLRNKVMLENSIDNATYVAYKYANKDIEVDSYENTIIAVTKNNGFEIGDITLEIDGIQIENINTIRDYLDGKNPGDTITIKIKRNNKEKEITNILEEDKKLGIMVITNYIFNNDNELNINFKTGEGGSSGGLVLALGIYQEVSGVDILKGRNIAGTGTIDINGNIGEIDGIKYKIAGAVKRHMDVVLVPPSNYEEAMQVVKDNNYHIDIVKISTFDEAIKYLLK
jgi:PDZ domain-containing protein